MPTARKGEESTCSEASEPEGQEPSPKRPKAEAKKKSKVVPSNKPESEQSTAELERRKRAAAKAEDFAEAMRLKEVIEARASGSSKAGGATVTLHQKKSKVSERDSSKASLPQKRGHSPGSDDVGSPKPRKLAKKVLVEELVSDPFFDNKIAELVKPECVTACEQEAWRAVKNGNSTFLARKLVGKVPLFSKRDVVSKQTPLHLAITMGDRISISTLASEISRDSCVSKRMSSLANRGTGQMNPMTLGFCTGKIGAARGGKEMNNALVDDTDPPEPMQHTVGQANLKADDVKLLLSLGILQINLCLRRGGKIKRRGVDTRLKCGLDECLEPAALAGRIVTVRTIIDKFDSFGVNEAHKAGVSETPGLHDKVQGRTVATKLKFGGGFAAVHLAAINPDSSKLAGMLKMEPSAVSLPTDAGHQPIHIAAACENPATLNLLLSEWNANRSAHGHCKRLPLHYAAAAGRVENIALLMGGKGLGSLASISFAKAVTVVLGRQSGVKMKIGADSAHIVSLLLVDLVQRITEEAVCKDNQTKILTFHMLQDATQAVLKGEFASKIASKAREVGAGRLALPRAPSGLVRKLTEVTEDVMHRMFETIDKNDDGKLDQAEIAEVFASGGMRLNKKALAKLMKEMDTDGSGEVEFDEFLAWMNARSTSAIALRRHLVVKSGDMGQAEVAEAEGAMEEALLHDIKNLAFDPRELLDQLVVRDPSLPKSTAQDGLDAAGAYVAALLECACTKILEVASNVARSQKKTTITPDNILSGLKSNEQLHKLFKTDSVVMNSQLLPAKDKLQYTALHLAAERGHIDCVEALVGYGADVNEPGPERKTPLAIAAERGHTEIVRFLVDAGAKLEKADKRKRTPLLLAVRSGHAVAASILINRGANVDAADDSGNTVAHYAAAFGWVECLNLIHKAGANLAVANAMKLAPISAALMKGHKTVFRRMLEIGIDVNFRDADGSTLMINCLSTVSRLVYNEIQFMLSKNADARLCTSQGMSVLHAVASASVNGVEYIEHPFEAERLKRLRGWEPRPAPKVGSDVAIPMIDGESDDDDTPGAAHSGGRMSIVAPAEEQMPEKVYERGLHQLTTEEREAVFRLGWTANSWQAGDNPTVPWLSLDDKQREAASLLGLGESSWLATPVRAIVGQRGSDGNLPVQRGMAVGASDDGMVCVQFQLESGTSRSNFHVSRLLLDEEDLDSVWRSAEHISAATARLLLDRGAPVDSRDASGSTPLMLALHRGSVDLALLLLEYGADANAEQHAKPVSAGAVPRQPLTPLLCASAAPQFGLALGVHTMRDVVKNLLAKGASVPKIPRLIGYGSPMISFLRSGNFDCASLLLDAGSDPRADGSGENALHVLFSRYVFQMQEGGEAASVAFAKRLLASDTGSDLMTEFSAFAPRVTPIYFLVDAFVKNQVRACHALTETLVSQARARGALLIELLESIPSSVDLSKWLCRTALGPDGKTVTHPPPTSLLALLCLGDSFQLCPEVGGKAVEFLCARGVNPNASSGSPAALHSLAERLNGNLSVSPLVQTLLPLTNLDSLMPSGHTLLTYILDCCVNIPSFTNGARASVEMLIYARCDVNKAEAVMQGSAFRPLHFGARLRDESFVTMLLSAGADPRLLDGRKRTPLHVAVSCAPSGADANFDIEELLLRHKADATAQDINGYCALHYAFMKAADRAMSFDGRWIKTKELNPGVIPQPQWTHQAWMLVGTRIDPIETVSSLCALPDIDVNARGIDGMMPLHLACLRGASVSALKLLKAGAKLEEQFRGNTPLGLAMQSYPDTGVLLMQRGADPNASCTFIGGSSSSVACTGLEESMFSLTLRNLAQLKGSERMSSYLGAALSSLDCGFLLSKALNDAISSGQFVMLLTLIPKIGDDALRGQRFEKGQNLLHRLARSRPDSSQQQSFIIAARGLLFRGVGFEADDDGRTPLHLASLSKNFDLVELLRREGAEDIALVCAADKAGITSIGHAFAGSHDSNWASVLKIVKHLISRGGSARAALVDAEKKISVLMHCISQHKKAINVGVDQEGWSGIMFANEAPDVTVLDYRQRSCLTYAASAQSFSVEYLRLIVEWSAKDPVAQATLVGVDDDGLTALMIAIKNDNVAFVDVLLSSVSSISRELLRRLLAAQDLKKRTALMLAVGGNDGIGLVCSMLSWMDDDTAEAVLPMTDDDGCTALMRAVVHNSEPIVKALLPGRPLPPQSTSTTCPSGKMAGDGAHALATYIGSKEGAPAFSITWLSPDRVGKALFGSTLLTYEVELTIPPGVGPGVSFTVPWSSTAVGPGSPGLAGSFANSGDKNRRGTAALSVQDSRGFSVLHCCVCPLPFGSYENVNILRHLVEAGAPVGLRDTIGRTASDLAAAQRSGMMLECFRGLGVPGVLAPSFHDRSLGSDSWPDRVDADADAASTMAANELVRAAQVEPPVEKHFQKPSASSRVSVAIGSDGGPLDLVMTKVDLSKCPVTQNVFYRMQVLHERNQDNYFLFTRWGRIGDRGQFQTTPFESLARAELEFTKIFKSKAGNEWKSRASFVKQPNKYQLHELKYSSTAPKDVLRPPMWRQRLPAKVTPLELRVLLNVASEFDLLQSVLQEANLERPLGLIKRQPLAEARERLEEIRLLVSQKTQELKRSEPSGDRLQEIGDAIAAASSRIFELVPTKNFKSENASPIDNRKLIKRWMSLLDETDDVACAARLLLGAQANMNQMSTIDYIYRALGIRVTALAHDSVELGLLERFINTSAPGECMLFTGAEALPLPEIIRNVHGQFEQPLPVWQAFFDVPCYFTPNCSESSLSKKLIVGGCCYTEYGIEGDAICVQKASLDGSAPALWVPSCTTDRSPLLRRLSLRETLSKVAAIHRVERRSDATWKHDDPSQLLFHGSGMANLLSILADGLRIRPPTAQHSGSAFGNGVYFGNSFCKSRNYSKLHHGVGFMLLCEVAMGKPLEVCAFSFPASVRDARVRLVREKLGVSPDVKIADHPELNAAVKEIDAMMLDGEVDDVAETGCTSTHYMSSAMPDPVGSVMHPEGFRVPCGRIVSRNGSLASPSNARDELIIYDTSRACLRYIVELRDPSFASQFRDAPAELPVDAPSTQTPALDTLSADCATQAADIEMEDDAEPDEDEDVEDKDSDDDDE